MQRVITVLGMMAMAMAAAGCGPVQLDPIEDEGASPDPIVPGTPVSRDPHEGANALVMRLADVPPGGPIMTDPGFGELFPPDALTSTDPDALAFFFSNQAQSCPAPWAAVSCDVAPAWQLALAVPSNRVQPGAVIDLNDASIGFVEAMALGTVGACGGRGGGYGPSFSGQLEIVSRSASDISVKIRNNVVGSSTSENGETTVFGFDGDYVATDCAAAP